MNGPDWSPQLQVVAAEVLRLLCSLEVEAAPGPAPLGPCAWVACEGAFTGVVVVVATPRFAQTAAARALGSDPNAISGVEVQDLLEELASMIAGNLKASLPGPTSLALPVYGPPPEPVDGQTWGNVRYTVDGEAMLFTLFATSGSPRPVEGSPDEDPDR